MLKPGLWGSYAGLSVLLVTPFLYAAEGPDLTADQLQTVQQSHELLPMSAFTPPSTITPAQHRFAGRLQFSGAEIFSSFVTHKDQFQQVGDEDSPARHIPSFSYDLVQWDKHLIPVQRGPRDFGHPHWQMILEPGRVWQEEGDGDYSRAAMPFALQEYQANCTHNGVLTFRYSSEGAISHMAYQVSSETCLYMQADMWGMLDVSYIPAEIIGAESVVANYQQELQSRMPQKPIEALANDFPGFDTKQLAHPEEVSPSALSVYGVVADGVHYRSKCLTRAGNYPFCDELTLPSYSLAKSAFAGAALMRLEYLYPGTKDLLTADYVPQCVDSGNWNDVTFAHLLDMSTGNYLSDHYHGDESADHVSALFFRKYTHAEKINYSCNYFPRKTMPGTDWHYRTSNTYILGTAMNAFLKQQRGPGADIFDDLLVPDIFGMLNMSPVSGTTLRSDDAVAQPLAGFGLSLQPGDMAKLADFFNQLRDGSKDLLDQSMVRGALQLPSNDGGAASEEGSSRYNNGFWAAPFKDIAGCEEAQWIPFMSGYGGITVAILPNGLNYYYVSDGGEFAWGRAARELARAKPLCAD
ncbi:MAG: hypothetical protein V7711_10490 [Pseudomonadales bacterium]